MAQPQPSYVMQPATVSPVQTQQVTPLQAVPQQVVPMQSQQQVQTQPQYVVNKDTKNCHGAYISNAQFDKCTTKN